MPSDGFQIGCRVGEREEIDKAVWFNYEDRLTADCRGGVGAIPCLRLGNHHELIKANTFITLPENISGHPSSIHSVPKSRS